MMDTWAKWDFEIWPFFDAKMANLGPVDFQLGLPLIINENEGQKKFEVHISKNGKFSAQNRTPLLPQLRMGVTRPF